MTGSPLLAPVSALKGVGPKVASRCEKLGLVLVRDLLFHLPLRYEDRTRVTPLGALRPGMERLVEGTVELAQVQYGRRRALLVRVADGTGAITLRFFHFNAMQQRGFVRGARIRCYGEARPGPAGIEMVHPEYQIVAADAALPVDSRLTPVYPATEGLTQTALRRLSEQALAALDQDLSPADPVDGLLACEPGRLPRLADALRLVHRPPPAVPVEALLAGRHPAQRRLAVEELLAHHLSLRLSRERFRIHRAPTLTGTGRLASRLLQRLGFALTGAQRRVCAEIDADLAVPEPMLRLLQGDVGAGKTIVAALAALKAVEHGMQAALMAPTELLAEQHLRTFRRWMEPLGVPVLWLSGRLTRTERARTIQTIATTPGAIVVGTHALFQSGVDFHALAIAIIDEQHRFGVHQRLALRDKGAADGLHPHQLVMTATPIPRTLAMTAYAELDVSVIDELPPGRTPIATVVLPDSRRADIVERIAAAVRAGRQIYWVCTLIEESDELEAQAATEAAQVLGESLPEVRVGLVHGRMKDDEKDAAMRAFLGQEIDLLVATTVIEVGVDVPNASLMVIENAERLGLAQLHQLRGRVGRGSRASDCVLMYRGPLSDMARERLRIMRETTDGFAIAQRDLDLRGPGEFLGTRQAGAAGFRIADLARDADLIDTVARIGERLQREVPAFVPELVERWIGGAARYAQV
ncbi:MAG: ATP-dependent DNA helicase RecG [Gammaproteobacteria bacterium]